jgi:hypothetical protein
LEEAADGEVDLDDEDPDMEDWGDLYASNNDDAEVHNDEDVESAEDDIPDMGESDDEGAGDDAIESGDDDDFMDAADSGDSSDSDENAEDDDAEEIDENAIQTGIVGIDNNNESSDASENDGIGFMENSDSDVDLDDLNGAPAFADAEDYEEMVSNSWNELKRGSQSSRTEEEPKKKRKTKSIGKTKKA